MSLPGQLPSLPSPASVDATVESHVESIFESTPSMGEQQRQSQASLKDSGMPACRQGKTIVGAHLADNLRQRARRATAYRGLLLGIVMIALYYFVLGAHFRIDEIAEVQDGIEGIIMGQTGETDRSGDLSWWANRGLPPARLSFF